METRESDANLSASVVYASAPNAVWSSVVSLNQPLTVAEVIALSGFEQTFPDINLQAAGVGLFGRNCSLDDLVSAGARIEIYRPLTFDPMQSRRRRAAHRKAQVLAKKKPRVKHKRHDRVKPVTQGRNGLVKPPSASTTNQPTEKGHG
jgi:hypothetical protein